MSKAPLPKQFKTGFVYSILKFVLKFVLKRFFKFSVPQVSLAIVCFDQLWHSVLKPVLEEIHVKASVHSAHKGIETDFKRLAKVSNSTEFMSRIKEIQSRRLKESQK